MTVEFDIEKALFDSVNAAKLLIPEIVATPVVMPNHDLDQYPDLWLKVNVVRGNTTPITLGQGGSDDHNGFLQIDINVPTGTGSGVILKIASALKYAFPAGRSIGPVVVRSSGVSSGRLVGSWYRISVTVTYYSRIARVA